MLNKRKKTKAAKIRSFIAANPNATARYIADQLGFPIQGVVGTNVITFSGVNADRTALTIDPSYYNGSNFGVLPTTFYTDTAVNFNECKYI